MRFTGLGNRGTLLAFACAVTLAGFGAFGSDARAVERVSDGGFDASTCDASNCANPFWVESTSGTAGANFIGPICKAGTGLCGEPNIFVPGYTTQFNWARVGAAHYAPAINGNTVTTSIRQNVQIPYPPARLSFDFRILPAFDAEGDFAVKIDNTTIFTAFFDEESTAVTPGFANYAVVGPLNLDAFAGKTRRLTFEATTRVTNTQLNSYMGSFEIDRVSIDAPSTGVDPPSSPRRGYVVSRSDFTLSVFDTATNAPAAASIPIGGLQEAIAITPDGTRAYIGRTGLGGFAEPGAVDVFDTTTNKLVGSPIPVGPHPADVAITPDGSRVYVVHAPPGNSVTVIDTATNTAGPTPIPVGGQPLEIAISPDGARAYIPRWELGGDPDGVVILDLAANSFAGLIETGQSPEAIALSPDGTRAYVANHGPPGSLVAIDLATNSVVGPAVSISSNTDGIEVSPDGSRVYVISTPPSRLLVIDTATMTPVADPITLPQGPFALALSPDGSRLYVTEDDFEANPITQVFDTATNTPIAEIPVDTNPRDLAIIPNQAPTAAFTASAAPAGSATTFDATGSSDSDGSVARYDWDFGDGTTLADGGSTPRHTYQSSGAHTVTLTVTDNEGCSTAFVTSGRTAYCNGKPSARTTREIPDSDAPEFKLGGKKKQEPDAAIEVKATCDEACTLRGRGVIVFSGGQGRSSLAGSKLRLKPATKAGEAGKRTTLQLKLPGKKRAAALAALRQGRRGRVQIKVTATDAAGNAANKKRTVKLVR